MAGEQNSDERQTTNPTLVRSVVEKRGGFPAHKAQTEGEGDHGLIVLGEYGDDEDVTEITWDEFEDEFKEKDLKFVYPTGPNANEVGTLRKQDDV